MSFTILDIPESHADLVAWLEEQLLGLDLADVVAGIEVFGGDDEDAGDVLAKDRLATVLEQGLGALDEAVVRSLLKRPRTLLSLQESVLVDGGDYWRGHGESADMRQATDRVWESVRSSTTQPGARPSHTGGGATERRSPWTRVLSIAVAVMIGLFGWWQFQQSQPTPSGWGWEKPGALAQDLSAEDYLQQLADGAGDWFKKRPEDEPGLRKRLRQFRNGCDTLLKAPHTPLAAADREWLNERCRAWRDKIDGHIAALDAGTPPLEVRETTDETINKLVAALKGRAASVG